MQQRRPRLGDILDDYCPRERRITNHVVVAMINDGVKQTRCTTCDADHEYKEARIPPQRRKRPEDGAADPAQPGRLRPTDDDMPVGDDVVDDEGAPDDGTGEDEPRLPEDDGPVHRRLIRATLPRQEGQVPERKEPEFTIRQPGMRGPDGRNKGGRGRRPMHGPQQGGGWQGQGQGPSPRQGSGFGQGQPRQGGGGPRQGGGQGNRPPGNPGGPRGTRQGPPSAGGRGGGGGRKRGR